MKKNNGHRKLKSDISKFIDKSETHLFHHKEKDIVCYSGDALVESYIANFKRMMKRNNVSRDEWADELLGHLRGQARELIMPNEQSKMLTFKEMCSKLISHFAPASEPSECVAQLRARIRKEGDNILALQHWFTVIGLKAYPEVEDKERDRFVAEYFMNALTDDDQRDYVVGKNPKSMTKTASYANRFQVRQKTRALYARDKGGYAKRRDHGRQIRAVNFNNGTVEKKVNHDECNCKLQDTDNKMVSLTDKIEAVVRAVTASNNNNNQ